MGKDERAELGWRMVLYRLLSRGFSYPTPHLAEELVRGSYQAGLREGLTELRLLTAPCYPLSAEGRLDSLPLSEREAKRLPGGINLLERSCREADPAVLAEELEVEYTRLFINGYPRIVATPYASVY
ncbi:MAG: molecular chaperone TorD family protein, partial [Bacillota bacterium]|nr:molecular chaperone TorD family protein [Bacillota bacterium]